MMNALFIGLRTGLIWAMALICISGCSDSKTVDYYYNHQLEAREKVKECKKEEGGLKSSEACMNAIQAVIKWANTMNAN
jgi:hypothetical protein